MPTDWGINDELRERIGTTVPLDQAGAEIGAALRGQESPSRVQRRIAEGRAQLDPEPPPTANIRAWQRWATGAAPLMDDQAASRGRRATPAAQPPTRSSPWAGGTGVGPKHTRRRGRMPTGLRAEHHPPQLTAAEPARAEVRRLTERQRELPNLMREAARRGAFQLVAELRIEWDELPARLWAARYTAVHSELAAWDVPTRGQRDRHDVEMQAARLAQEVRG